MALFFGHRQASNRRKNAVLGLMLKARAILRADDEMVVSVSEHDCRESGCCGARTVVLVMRLDQPTEAVRIDKPIDSVTQADLSLALARTGQWRRGQRPVARLGGATRWLRPFLAWRFRWLGSSGTERHRTGGKRKPTEPAGAGSCSRSRARLRTVPGLMGWRSRKWGPNGISGDGDHHEEIQQYPRGDGLRRCRVAGAPPRGRKRQDRASHRSEDDGQRLSGHPISRKA
jgi:hypothetical protein